MMQPSQSPTGVLHQPTPRLSSRFVTPHQVAFIITHFKRNALIHFNFQSNSTTTFPIMFPLATSELAFSRASRENP